MRFRSALAGILFAAAAVPAVRAASAGKGALITPAERAAARQISPELLRAHIRFLAGDGLEGRAPATRGDRLAQAYIAAELESLGLEPAGTDGSWLQPFDIVGITSQVPETLALRRGADTVELRYKTDYVAFSGVQEAEAKLDEAEVVFVGFGIAAPEYQWDDYKGADLRGKVLLMMNNDPEHDPSLFAGRARLYYGRWDYKYEIAALKGAAGAIIIHTTPSAGYGWQVVQSGWTGEQFSLPHEGGPVVPVKGWVTEDSARRIASLGGQDLDKLRAAALTREFAPVPLGVKVSLALKNEVTRKQTANVIGRLPGSDPALAKQAVVYSAHHDHLGMRTPTKPGEDVIYNGAVDNASGVAGVLAIARALKALPRAPRRSILFALVAAEESGLLGSKYLAAHPPLPAGRLAADINVDGLANIFGRTRDLIVIGLGKSTLDDHVRRLAAALGRVVVPDQAPDKGFFYRSDHFSLAKVGVPGVHFDEGEDVIGKPAGWGKQRKEKHEAEHYHQPSDELSPDWDFSGMVDDTRLFFYLGVKVANDAALPAWKPGDEFEAARKKALAEAR